MTKTSNINKNQEKKTEAAPSAEQYVKALENSVELLQREIENLRDRKSKSPASKQKEKVESSIIERIRQTLFKAKDLTDLSGIIQQSLSDKFNFYESELFYFTANNKLLPIKRDTTTSLNKSIKNFEEEGIIDWAIEKESVSFIPDLEREKDKKQIYVGVAPIFLRGSLYGALTFETDKTEDSFGEEDMIYIRSFAEEAAAAFDNIRSKEQIDSMNRELSEISKQIDRSSQFATIGEIVESISKELKSPIQIAETNVQLIEDGVGNSEKRLTIVKDQISKIKKINAKLNRYASYAEKSGSEESELEELINEVLSLAEAQLRRDGITVESTAATKPVYIYGQRPNLQRALLNAILNARDSMPDGGTITIDSFYENGKAVVTITDDGIGFGDETLKQIFNISYSSENKDKLSLGLYSANEIIKKHKGKLDIYSQIGKGTTLKIFLPAKIKKKIGKDAKD